jgi:hypothetical protein
MSSVRRTCLLVLIAALARPAAAAVDLTGTWTVHNESGSPQSWSIVQSGTSISVTVSGNTFTGPIDPNTGQFSFVTPPTPCPAGVSATASSNDAFSGTLTLTSPSCPGGPHTCTCVPSSQRGLNGCRDGAAGACCGDGVVDLSEQCDPGPQFMGCCDGLCQLKPVSAACADEGNSCTDNLCDGAGTCTHPTSAAGTPCSEDGNFCTDDVCNSGGTCTHPPLPDTDGDGTCDAADLCTSTATLDDARAVVVGFTTPAIADDRFSTRIRMILAAAPNPPLDPSQNGFRIMRRNANGSVVYDRTISPGSGWTSNSAGNVFRFRSDTTRARVVSAASDARRVKVVWRDEDPFVAQPMLPLGLTAILYPFASTGDCIDVSFDAASCSLNGARAVCR